MLTHSGCSTNRREIGRRFQGIPPELEKLPLAFLHRDPIDTAVSLYHHVTHRDLRAEALDDRLYGSVFGDLQGRLGGSAMAAAAVNALATEIE